MQHRLSIDIGGTKTKLAVINSENKIVEKCFFSTKECSNEKEFSKTLIENIQVIFSNYDSSHNFAGIGIGAPSIEEKKGIINYAANLPFQSAYPIVQIIEKEFQIPTKLCRDSIAALLGEWKFGAGKSYDNIAMITIGTGLGGGFILNGQVAKGKTGLAGEIGHTSLFGNQRQCGCGKIGCLETYVSATGLKRTYFELLAKHCYPLLLKNIEDIVPSSRKIEAAAIAGEPLAIKTFQITGEVLGSKMADLILLLELEAIILGGGLAEAGDWIFSPAKKSMEDNLLESHKGKCQILRSAFTSNEGALLGAASLINIGS